MSISIKTSEAIDKISEALSLAQGEFQPVIKNRTNPHYKNKYSDLSAIFEATRPALTKYGLALLQFPQVIDGRVNVITLLVHKSGQFFEGNLSLKPQSDVPQHCGSAITYGRRYSAQAILGIDAEEDDDGNLASTMPPAYQPPQPSREEMEKKRQREEVLRAEKEAEEHERLLAKKRKMFTDKMLELGVAESVWDLVKKRLNESGRKLDAVQEVLDELELEKEGKDGITE